MKTFLVSNTSKVGNARKDFGSLCVGCCRLKFVATLYSFVNIFSFTTVSLSLSLSIYIYIYIYTPSNKLTPCYPSLLYIYNKPHLNFPHYSLSQYSFLFGFFFFHSLQALLNLLGHLGISHLSYCISHKVFGDGYGSSR